MSSSLLASLLRCRLLLRLALLLRLRFRSGQVGGGCLGARGEAALGDQVHGAIDRDADGASVFIDVVVGAERLFFLETDAVQLSALIFFELGIGERGTRIVALDMTRVRGSVGHERAE